MIGNFIDDRCLRSGPLDHPLIRILEMFVLKQFCKFAILTKTNFDRVSVCSIYCHLFWHIYGQNKMFLFIMMLCLLKTVLQICYFDENHILIGLLMFHAL
jgi:hypothetical protein